MSKLKQNVEDLNNILEKINATREVAERDLNGADWRTKPGLEIMKSQAKRELGDLLVEYAKALSGTVYKVFVSGTQEQTQKLADLLKKEGVLTFVAPSLYEEVTNKLTNSLGRTGEFTVTTYLKTIEFLSEFAFKYRVDSLKAFEQIPSRGIANQNELVEMVKEIARGAFGDTLNKAYLYNLFTESALSENFNKNVSVILFSNVGVGEKLKLSELLFPEQPSMSVSFTEDEEADRSLAAKIYRRISETKVKEVPTNKNTEQN